MTIAVLETGSPPDALLGDYGRYGEMMAAMLGTGPLPAYDVAESPLPAPGDHEGFILTGSPAGVYEDLPWIGRLADFLRAARGKTKLVGICFGHQMIAQAFGGRVEKSDKGWSVGLHEYAVIARQSWMDQALAVSIPASHQDQVVVQPPDTDVTLSSQFTPIAGLAWRNHPSISFQCHPEFSPAYAKALIETRRDRLPAPDQAVASLNGFNDNDRVGRWIGRFLGLAPPESSS